jgi:hypothetical protein
MIMQLLLSNGLGGHMKFHNESAVSIGWVDSDSVLWKLRFFGPYLLA